MSYGGFVSGMISTLKNNRKMSYDKKSLRDKYKEFEVAQNKKPLEYKSSMSPEDKKAFRAKLVERKRRGNIQVGIFLSLLFLVCVSIIIMISRV